MVIAMKKDALTSQVAGVIAFLKERGIEPRMVTTDPRTVLGVVDELDKNLAKELMAQLQDMSGVDEISSFTDSWKLVSRSFREDVTQIKAGPATIGGKDLMIMAGPCAVESREGYQDLARNLVGSGVTMLRGGAFKPRTSPYSFRGLGEEASR